MTKIGEKMRNITYKQRKSVTTSLNTASRLQAPCSKTGDLNDIITIVANRKLPVIFYCTVFTKCHFQCLLIKQT